MSLIANTGKGSTNGTNVTSNAVDTSGATVVFLGVASSGGVSATFTVSDSKGNTWTGLTLRGSFSAAVRIFYCISPVVGSGHTFSVTSGGGGTRPSIAVLAFNGSAVAIGTQNGAGGSGGSVNTGSVTPGSAPAGIVSFYVVASASAHAVTGGSLLKADSIPTTANNYSLASAWELQASATARAAAWTCTLTGNDDAAGAIAAFTFTAAGGGGQTFSALLVSP